MVLNRNVSLFPDVYVSGAMLVLGGVNWRMKEDWWICFFPFLKKVARE